jgi:glycosyltransferase involved in cell wall biosynthesis
MKSILYIQYTDPAAYPPLEHSSLLLAERGWNVRHLGTAASGAAKELAFPKHASIEVALRSAPAGGWRTAQHYLSFLAWCRLEIIRLQPDVIYCSDVMSYPVGLWASRRSAITTVLHEHDPPPRTGGGRSRQLLRTIRRRFARTASLMVIPQEERARLFLGDTGADVGKLRVVFNCPSQRELANMRAPARDPTKGFILWYHGALGSQQIPSTVIDALAQLPKDVRLELAGYETVSSKGYVSDLLARARGLSIADRVISHGALPMRADLVAAAARADVGLALFAPEFRDPMVGASNKPFDYLACGLPLLTNRTQEWEDFFGSQGVSVGCDPEDPDDIARVILALRNDPARRRSMADRGLELIRTQWNYETQFAPVLDVLEGVQGRLDHRDSLLAF